MQGPSLSRPIILRFFQFAAIVCVVGCTSSLLSDSKIEAVQRKKAAKSFHFNANKAYEEECTSCHVGFLPGFLPERSWKKLMTGLDDHFGENASLDEPVNSAISKYLFANAAEKPAASARSKKIARMIASNDAPIRITETPFWTRKHYSIKAYVWKRPKIQLKSKCEACHRDASKGIFSEFDVQIPK
jgi:hypothetical protein